MHYLALTFSTLLSSQASGAHRAGGFNPGLGQLDLLYEVVQAPVKPTRTSSPPAPQARCGRLPEGSAARTVVLMPVGFLRVGRRGFARSSVSCTPMRLGLHYASEAGRSTFSDIFSPASRIPWRPGRHGWVPTRCAQPGQRPNPWTYSGIRAPWAPSSCLIHPRAAVDHVDHQAQAPLPGKPSAADPGCATAAIRRDRRSPHRPSSSRAAGSRNGRAAGRAAPAPPPDQ